MLPFKSIPRLPYAARWMMEAHLVATNATCDRGPELLLDPGRHGVGAVLVRDGRRICSGYNGVPPGIPHCDDVGHTMEHGHCVATLHAEVNTIIQCALDQVSPESCDLFVTAAPCMRCAPIILRAKIKNVYSAIGWGKPYGFTDEVVKYLVNNGVEACEHTNVMLHLPRKK